MSQGSSHITRLASGPIPTCMDAVDANAQKTDEISVPVAITVFPKRRGGGPRLPVPAGVRPIEGGVDG